MGFKSTSFPSPGSVFFGRSLLKLQEFFEWSTPVKAIQIAFRCLLKRISSRKGNHYLFCKCPDSEIRCFQLGHFPFLACLPWLLLDTQDESPKKFLNPFSAGSSIVCFDPAFFCPSIGRNPTLIFCLGIVCESGIKTHPLGS